MESEPHMFNGHQARLCMLNDSGTGQRCISEYVNLANGWMVFMVDVKICICKIF